MFDSYCLNLNPMLEGEITTTESLKSLVARIEAHLELPPGIFCTRNPSGVPVKVYGDYSISLLRTAVIHYYRESVWERNRCEPIGIKRSSVCHHKKLALSLLRHGHEDFGKYFALVQKIAA
jgi:hypothetical protein